MIDFILFTSEQCIPCKNQRAILEELVADNPEMFSLKCLDIISDEAERYECHKHITAVPTLLIAQDDKCVAVLTGLQERAAVLREIASCQQNG